MALFTVKKTSVKEIYSATRSLKNDLDNLLCNFPAALKTTMQDDLKNVDTRYYVIDESASMSKKDGTLSGTSSDQDSDGVSRWHELLNVLKFHVQLVHCLKIPAELRSNCFHSIELHNGCQATYDVLDAIFSSQDAPTNPLHSTLLQNLHSVFEKIESKACQLYDKKTCAMLIIITDGAATSFDDFHEALKSYMRKKVTLPSGEIFLLSAVTRVSIRLCTDDEKLIEKYNNFDEEEDNGVSMDVDVLDDIKGEREEVEDLNIFIPYSPALHTVREFGITIDLFDKIDERTLTPQELHQFLVL